MQNKKTVEEPDVRVLELIAFQIMKSEKEDSEREEPLLLSAWHSAVKDRAFYRDQALTVWQGLAAVGVRLRVSNSAALDEFVEWCRTIPPRPAYTLEDELAFSLAKPELGA